MTDTQLLTLAIAVIVPLSLLIYSNSRITEAKETLRAEMRGLHNQAIGEIRTLQTEVRAGFERIEALLKIHELEHHK